MTRSQPFYIELSYNRRADIEQHYERRQRIGTRATELHKGGMSWERARQLAEQEERDAYRGRVDASKWTDSIFSTSHSGSD